MRVIIEFERFYMRNSQSVDLPLKRCKGDGMVYITGDTHRDFSRIESFCRYFETTTKDVMIILGDVGINNYGTPKDRQLKQALSRLPLTLFCLHGNHGQRPQSITGYIETLWHSGTVLWSLNFQI